MKTKHHDGHAFHFAERTPGNHSLEMRTALLPRRQSLEGKGDRNARFLSVEDTIRRNRGSPLLRCRPGQAICKSPLIPLVQVATEARGRAGSKACGRQ